MDIRTALSLLSEDQPNPAPTEVTDLHEAERNPRLEDYCDVKVRFPEADFWLIRKGDKKTVGKPTKTYSAEHIGIKVTSDELLPNYLYYMLEFYHSRGGFEALATGSLRLQHITTSQVKDLPVG